MDPNPHPFWLGAAGGAGGGGACPWEDFKKISLLPRESQLVPARRVG